MKKSIISLFLILATAAYAVAPDTYFFTSMGSISFTSNAPLETIKATSVKMKGLIDESKKTFSFIVPYRSFEGFNSETQREHFNEKYMESAEEKIEKINETPALAAVVPSTADVEAKNNAYKIALGKVLDGTTSDTEDKDRLRGELGEMLTAQAADCAKIADGDMVLYLKSGYEAKDTAGTPVGELDAPENMVFRNYGKNPGELQPDWDPVEHARNYTAQVYTDFENPDTTILKEAMVNPSKATIDGLPRGSTVWVRVRANGGSKGKGPWGNSINKIVP
jgi:hypothetical protein